jgi:hypothetical protein
MVCGFLMSSGFVMLRCFAMMFGGLLVMMRRRLMMLVNFRHCFLLSKALYILEL